MIDRGSSYIEMSTRKQKRANGIYGIELPNVELMRWKEMQRRLREQAAIECAAFGHVFRNVGLPVCYCVRCGQREEIK